ncbi:MAG: HAD-IC family P-type ATPase, partial [Clostridia bacterium]
NESVIAESKKYSNDYRVLLLAKSDSQIEFGTLPTDIQPIALVLLCDKIRAAAPGLVKYFNAQGVDVKIISGDNPITVSMIAKQCGVLGSEKYIDCSTLQTEREIRAAAFEYTVFGRVSPFQKKQIVLALKAQNHTVAMTGDGVNDVLAMKEADCSVAMGAGTDAARNVSKLVLLDSNFDALPSVIYEGRRSVNNIQRSAAFFLSKTIYSSVLAVVILAFQLFYPLHPIQQSFISVLFIGIPSFILALEPNKNRIEGSFFVNVLLKSLPMGITVTISTVSILFLSNPLCMTPEQTTS